MNLHIKQLSEFSWEQFDLSAGTVVWVPGEKVVMHQLPPPKAPKRKWSELIPWLLEDRILNKVEDMHFVLMEQQGDNDELNVATVVNDDIECWRALLAEQELDNCQLLPDFFALPWEPDSITVAQRDDLIIVRHGEFNGFVAEAQFAWAMINKLQGETPKQFTLLTLMSTELIPASFHGAIEQLGEDINWESASSEFSINLLSGNFRQNKKISAVAYWLPTAALLLLCLGLSFVYMSSFNASLVRQLEHTQTEYETNYRRLFPGLSRGSDGIREAIERYQQNRFRQRESLDTPVNRLLTGLDIALSTCTSCSVNTISLTQDGGELTVSNGTQINSSQFRVPGFRFVQSTASEASSTVITITRD